MNDMHLGIVGLGIIGRKVANQLLGSGFKLIVWDKKYEARKEFEKYGCELATSATELGKKSKIILLSLPTYQDVENVIFTKEGLIYGMEKGSLVVDMSTSMPHKTVEIAEKLTASEFRMLDAPISLGKNGIDIMVGGPSEYYEEIKYIFDAIGNKVTYAGASGQGNVFKLAQNMINAGVYASICEAFAFAKKLGANPAILHEAINNSAASSVLLSRVPEQVLDRKFKGTGTVGLHSKDIGYMLETARRNGALIPLTALIDQIFQWTKNVEGVNVSQFSIIKWWERQMGIEVSNNNAK